MRVNFQEISVRGVRRWKDPITGKQRQETKKFYQTISPFNRTKEGEVKNRNQIMEEIRVERDKWESEATGKEPA